MQLHEAKTILDEQVLSTIGRAIGKAADRIGAAVGRVTSRTSGGLHDIGDPMNAGLSRAMNITKSLLQVLSYGSQKGIKIGKSNWSQMYQGFYVPVDAVGDVPPTTIEQLTSDKRWNGKLGDWIKRATTAGYVVSLKMVGGRQSLFIDPVPDKEDIVGFYRRNNVAVDREAGDKSHREQMSKEELMSSVVKHRIEPWDLDEHDLLKLFPGVSMEDATHRLYASLASSRPYVSTLDVDSLVRFVEEFTSGSASPSTVLRGMRKKMADEINFDVAKKAAEKLGASPAEVAAMKTPVEAWDAITSHLDAAGKIKDPKARKGVPETELISMIKSGRLDPGNLDSVDLVRILNALGVKEDVFDPKRQVAMVRDLVRRTTAKSMTDQEILDALARGSYTGKQAVAALVAQLGQAKGLAMAQSVIRLAGEIPRSDDEGSLADQLDAVGAAKKEADAKKADDASRSGSTRDRAWKLVIAKVNERLVALTPSFTDETNKDRVAEGKRKLTPDEIKKMVDAHRDAYVKANPAPSAAKSMFDVHTAAEIMGALRKTISKMP